MADSNVKFKHCFFHCLIYVMDPIDFIARMQLKCNTYVSLNDIIIIYNNLYNVAMILTVRCEWTLWATNENYLTL